MVVLGGAEVVEVVVDMTCTASMEGSLGLPLSLAGGLFEATILVRLFFFFLMLVGELFASG